MKILTLARTTYKAFFKKDEYSRYLLSERFTKSLYPKYRFTEYGNLYQSDQTFANEYLKINPTSNAGRQLDRVFILDQFMKVAMQVPGDTVECGVYRGTSSYFICKHLVGTGRLHHGFDSWEGLSAPTEKDGAYWSKGSLTISEQTARDVLSPFDFARFYKGWIPDRFPEVADRQVALLHLDVDIYQPTLDSLDFFYPRMSSGGVIVCDDYGFLSCPGARSALDEFFADKPEPVVMLPSGQGLVLVGKHC